MKFGCYQKCQGLNLSILPHLTPEMAEITLTAAVGQTTHWHQIASQYSS